MRIELRRGDITEQPDIDAIVNAANTELWLGSGVAGAIAARGGRAIEKEAISKGPIRLGEAIETTAGDLPNRFVIHAAAMGHRDEDAAVPKWPGSQSSADIIRNATTNSLAIVERLECRSIAFPALATGVGGFPVDQCAQAMLGSVRAYDDAHPDSCIEKVVFVLFGESDYAGFMKRLDEGS